MKRSPLSHRTPLRATTPLRRVTPLTAARSLNASAAQREKVALGACVVCRRRPVDPAHLVPRSLGGCDHRNCVVALCRRCHRAYDSGRLDLLVHLEPAWRVEVAHAVAHVGLLGAWRRLTGQRSPAA